MSHYLTQEWLDDVRKLAKDQPKRPGISAKLQVVVSGGPDGDVKWSWVVKDGKLTVSELGIVDDADVTLTLPYADAVAVSQGELDPNAAFMQGRMKVAGDVGKMLQLLPITRASEYQGFDQQLRAITSY